MPRTIDVLSTLQVEGDWMTPQQVAERLGAKKLTVSSMLSKLAQYGKIEREYLYTPRTATTQRHRYGRYRAPEGAPGHA